MDDTTGVVIRRLREEGFLDADQPEAIVGDLLRIACGWEDDPDAAKPGETSDRAFIVKLRDLLDDLSIDGDGTWTAQLVLGDLAREALRQRVREDAGA